ncbi:MAG: FAD-dependent oxidoreductase [Acidobacteria bacterium]|nr:FAD-dependent oxidoreductase [Acidobacteriota bacterium]
MRKSYDFIIVGAGVFGAWTTLCLRQSGFAVALLDAYGAANGRASSGGETRVARTGYGPDELYTRWAARSLVLWKEFADRRKRELFHKTGFLWLSDDSDPYTGRIFDVLTHNGIPCRELSAPEIRQTYAQFSFSDIQRGILETESGVLMAREAVQALVKEAIESGVEYRQVSALPPLADRQLKEIETTAGERLSAAVFIFTSGPWLPKLFPDLLANRLRPTRQEVFFLGVPPGDDSFRSPRMPVWLHHTHPKRPYALPDIANRGFKIAFDRHGPEFDPDDGSRVVAPGTIDELRAYLRESIPALKNAPIVETRVCQYENTSNGDFLIDRYPGFENLWLVGGGSGHGFKHGPMVGEYVRDLVLGKISAVGRFSLATKEIGPMRAVF